MIGWIEQKEIRTVCLCVCMWFFFLFLFIIRQTWLTEHSFCVMQKSGIIHLLC